MHQKRTEAQQTEASRSEATRFRDAAVEKSTRHVSVTAGNQWLKEKDGGPTRVFSHRPSFFISFLSFPFHFHVAGNRRSEQERKTRLTDPSTAEQISRRHGDDRGVTWNSAASLSAALHTGSIGYASAF